jgi:hypothetical protein
MPIGVIDPSGAFAQASIIAHSAQKETSLKQAPKQTIAQELGVYLIARSRVMEAIAVLTGE